MNHKKDIIKFSNSPAFKNFSKVLYLTIILNEIKKDPGLWITFSHKKQVELHKIKKELDKKYSKRDLENC